jgi:autotransporter-associated beta strand protein
VDNSTGTVTLVVGNNDATTTFSGVLQNSGGTAAPLGLTKVGSGTFTLASTNAYSGLTTVQSGVLYLGAAGAMPGPVSVTGGTLDLTGFAQTIASVSIGNLGTLDLGFSNLIASAGTDIFGGTLNLSGFNNQPGALMTYTGHSGTFTNVIGLNGAYQLLYGATELDVVSSGPPRWLASSGSWNTGSNWTSGSAPSGPGAIAIVGLPTNSSVNITLDTPQTLGALVLTNSGGNPSSGYLLDAGSAGSLTLDNSGSTALIVVNAGIHAITAPVNLVGGDLTVSASLNGILTISGDISQDITRNLTLNGDGSGELILSGSNSLGGSGGTATVSSGTLVLNTSEALADGTSLTVGDASFFAGGIQPAGGAAAAPTLAISPVPEPGTLALLVAAAFLLLVRRRRL